MLKENKTKPLLALALLIFVSLATLPIQAQRVDPLPQRSPVVNPAASPQRRLVVAIIVDQFRYDYLERFGDLFTNGGFRRLINQGAFFTNANYDYIPTFTAPGHACIFTGSIPALNGIVGNLIYDRATNKTRNVVTDEETRLVTSRGVEADRPAQSPRVLIGTTISDQLRWSNNFQSKVVAISYKDRSAILPGGIRPNGAYWFNSEAGEFVTSDYYTKEFPAWVKKFNSTDRPDKYFNARWDRVLPAAAYRRAQEKNLDVQRSPVGRSFPYTVTGGDDKPGKRFYDAFQYTPFGSEYLEKFARAAIEGEHLGEDRFVDLLSVSFSSPDLTGHAFGPDSQEVLDTYVRLDRLLAEFLNYLDQKIGLANITLFVTGDHGVSPVPEYAKSLGYDADRLSSVSVSDAVKKALGERFGDEKLYLAFVNEQIFLDHRLIAEKKLNPAEVERVAGEAVMTVPGVVNYFTRSQILSGRVPSGIVGTRVVNGFHPQRSGDVAVILKPFWFIAEGPLATTHGSVYNYDTHVPVIFFGAGVRPGRYNAECAPSDIAPTLAALLAVEMPSNRSGRVLVEAIAGDRGQGTGDRGHERGER
jgi:predicted AlkP superfamily pyrophosphatase or phosphodiesterase